MPAMTDLRAGDTVAEAAGPPLVDETAFSQLYADAARPLWAYLYRVTGDTGEAEDLMQEAFLRLLRAPVGDLDHASLRAYLFRIAGNLAVDRFRGRRREAARDQAWRDGDRETQAAQVPDLDVTRSFDRLTPRQRALLWMAYVEGSAHGEIAAALKLKPASVRVLLFRARRRLRDMLARATGAGR